MKCEITGFGLQDIFLFIGLKARTGELMLESGNNIGTMVFHEGRILQTFSPYSRAIGDLLVENRVITEDELLAMLKLQKENPISPVGGLFVKTGKVSLDVVEMMVHKQIRQSVAEFVTWNDLRVSFQEKHIHPFDRIHLPIYEFLQTDVLKSSKEFFARKSSSKPAPSETASIPAR